MPASYLDYIFAKNIVCRGLFQAVVQQNVAAFGVQLKKARKSVSAHARLQDDVLDRIFNTWRAWAVNTAKNPADQMPPSPAQQMFEQLLQTCPNVASASKWLGVLATTSSYWGVEEHGHHACALQVVQKHMNTSSDLRGLVFIAASAHWSRCVLANRHVSVSNNIGPAQAAEKRTELDTRSTNNQLQLLARGPIDPFVAFEDLLKKCPHDTQILASPIWGHTAWEYVCLFSSSRVVSALLEQMPQLPKASVFAPLATRFQDVPVELLCGLMDRGVDLRLILSDTTNRVPSDIGERPWHEAVGYIENSKFANPYFVGVLKEAFLQQEAKISKKELRQNISQNAHQTKIKKM